MTTTVERGVTVDTGRPTAPAQFAMMGLITAHWRARCVQVAAELGVADVLWDGPVPVEDLARTVGAEPSCLRRLLRALATVGVFELVEPDTCRNTELSATLASRHPASVGAVAELFGSRWHQEAWRDLGPCVRTGVPAFDIARPEGLVDHLDDDPDASAAFDAGMRDLGRLGNRALAAALAPIVARAPDRSVVSVSGGHSTLPLDLVQQRTASVLTLVDRSSVVRRWRTDLVDQVDAGTLRLVACPIPDGVGGALPARSASVVLLDRVVHDWDDATAARLLRDCAGLLRPDGCLVVVEQLLGGDDPAVAFLDLQMLVHRGGLERSADDLARLAGAAGLGQPEVLGTFSPMSLVVLRPTATRDHRECL